MKIHCLGGGPAGLYFAILHKKANPSAEIVVHERNAPDDTFGWGVVFSDATLGELEEWDAESYRAITERFAYWDAIDVHVADRVIRSGGHGFCGISRRELLILLQRRARDLGVELRFGREVTDPEALRRDCDLLVACDGIHSVCRKTWEGSFRPSLELGDARYIWLGTTKQLEAFTFIFRQSEHGLFQVHAYQFNPEHSTFIVECSEAAWRASGLCDADEATSIDYCQRLFAPELDGHRLLGNRSSWLQFVTVSNERWTHDNVALMGDSAHTAHFSVGSGTKMAMEDAHALAVALGRHDRIAAALEDYEENARQSVGRIQKAASQSQAWFEEAARHVRHAPERMVFSMLSRTRRVSHDNLAVRDAAYIESVDRWYMRDQGIESEEIVPPMFTPLTLRGARIDNRVVVSPMCQYCATDGVPDDWHLVHLGSRAIGGPGLLLTEMTCVSPEGRITPGCAGLWNDAQAAAWARIVEFVKGAAPAVRFGMQLGHSGRKGSTKLMWEGMDEPLPTGGWDVMGPSPLPWTADNPVPREMTRDDMVAVREQFVEAARRADRCGFDLLELHCAHGYLLSSFLTPVSNQRGDGYGGDLAGRARFPLEVIDAVRQVWADRPLSVRISATDWVGERGLGIDDAVELSGWLKDRGVDVVDVSTGQTTPDAEPVYGRAWQMPFSERIRNDVGIPTITVGNIWTADQIDTILVAGRADLVALARAHLVDPYFTLRAAAERGLSAPERWPLQYRSAEPMAVRMAQTRRELEGK